MKKYKVICFINSAGINVILKNIEDTMNSIKNNINVEFGFYICTDTEDRKKTIDNIVKKNNLSNVVIEIVVKTKSWAKNFNEFFIKYKDDADYILCSHDDLIIRTFDFFNITMNEISGHEDEIGWIAYTSDSYYRISNISVCQTAREMFCKDRFTWPKTYELHKMETSYNKDYLDMPQRTCKVAGFFLHLNLIKTENLEKIGLCPEWGNYTLLTDEHWSLATLVKNMWTVWVPQVFYDHPIRGNERVFVGIQNQAQTESQFYNLWGFDYQSPLSDEKIKEVCNKFQNTNIGFFNDKNTYNYQYLK